MKLAYPAIFTAYEDGSGGYAVEFPDLPGCITGGDDMADAIFLAEDAASGWVLTELEEGKKAPKASELGSINTEPGQFVNLVALDMEAYVKENNISCSAVLQETLSKMAQLSIQ